MPDLFLPRPHARGSVTYRLFPDWNGWRSRHYSKLAGLLVSRAGKGGIPFQIQQDEGKFNLLGFLPLDGGEHLRWKFEFKNGNLVGTFSAMHDNPKKWKYDRIGAMTATKATPPATTESK